MPVSPCCEYYGYLPRLIRKSASTASASAAALPAASTSNPLPSSTVSESNGVPRAESSIKPPSIYRLSKPLTYPVAELPPKPAFSLRLVIISDTHERHHEMTVPHGDVLVHCGDIQDGVKFCRSTDSMLVDFSTWINDPALHPHPVKLIIAGNHDKAIAGMSVDAVRRLFAPALYLCNESALIEPVGVRVYGSPRSIANSRLSPNTAFQSNKSWLPFMFPTARTDEDKVENASLEQKSRSPLRVRLEGTTPGGPIDMLMTHQSPDTVRARHTVEEQPICTYVQQVAPRRVFFCGHLHAAHGMHRLPVPLVVQEAFGLRQTGNGLPAEQQVVGEIPFTPCINASMMMGLLGRGRLLPASVVDLEL
ncbi:hypothetical protein ABB37_03644 [Leptomonas pyrrhocoris]|uniref:Calcineurin-like phosphoesterase domain-containing protein n=1 Tax=Leptomonas pyrrhocoris TaxID=157538 RepID=A0A0N0VFQ8_LEPPY|nr:hypothetical protein ABB37_03644 [Leptomonas pyrrhocoris]KPA81224.1 hypothetical protein ABB37_03644 [Leptomonas pyrrhocoris]|eukprot:XP_015659663.1 hypothetical protein ABB37_03644 [Leptomonas pyrrhocoris]